MEIQDNLLIVQGDATSLRSVDETIRGAQAVIVSLGVGIASDPSALAVCSVATELIIKSMKRHKVSRLLVVSSMGVGDSFNDISERARTFLKPYLDDKEIQERSVMDSGLEWIIVRPAGLRDGGKTGKYKFGKGIASATVSRGDVADFTLKQLTDNTWLRQTPSIAGDA
ncbi:hypothetical protein HDU67_008134 [Dinochytrium kinnereticum]|nr:hypothetical protein HDU67_008134 [Dinochytrium kinnereticum]